MWEKIISVVLLAILQFRTTKAESQSNAPNFYSSYFQQKQQQGIKVPGKENVAFENRYRQKFDEIFRAYSEGYKAAMMAVQARSVIPHPQDTQASAVRIPKASIPQKPIVDNFKQNLVASRNQPGTINQLRSKIAINHPITRQLTVNAIEKSGIPRPLLNALIARRKAQVLAKRNEVMTSPEGFNKASYNPLTQFLKQQNAKNYMMQKRYQIPQMNYNSDIDPSWYVEPRLPRQAAEMSQDSTKANLVQNAVKKNIPFKNKRSPIVKTDRQRRSHAPYLGQNLDAFGIVRVVPHLDDKPARKAIIPKPKPLIVAQPQKQENKRVEIPYPEQDSVFQPVMTERSEIPHANQQNNYLQNEVLPVAPVNLETEEQKRDKIARLNAAARHRNVYYDVMGGDPYGSSSGVVSRNFISFAKHRRRRHSMK